MKKVLSIIVSYNFEPWLDKCLQSLLSSSYPTDIMVIDNASKDRTVPLLKAKYPSVILLESPTNLGFGKANNMGMEYALRHGYDYVFLVNQDAWIDKDCIKHLITCPAADYALLSPVHYDGTEKALDKGFQEYIKQHYPLKEKTTKVNFVNAAFWFIATATLRKVGLFSPIFYHYGEDKDFTNRLRFHNIDILVVNDALAYHDRQNREVPAGINFKGEFVYHLTEFCNINYRGTTAFAKAVLACLKKAGQQLSKGKAKAAYRYIRIAGQLSVKTQQVIKTRKENKKINN